MHSPVTAGSKPNPLRELQDPYQHLIRNRLKIGAASLGKGRRQPTGSFTYPARTTQNTARVGRYSQAPQLHKPCTQGGERLRLDHSGSAAERA